MQGNDFVKKCPNTKGMVPDTIIIVDLKHGFISIIQTRFLFYVAGFSLKNW